VIGSGPLLAEQWHTDGWPGALLAEPGALLAEQWHVEGGVFRVLRAARVVAAF
jgi:hypothetical protein